MTSCIALDFISISISPLSLTRGIISTPEERKKKEKEKKLFCEMWIEWMYARGRAEIREEESSVKLSGGENVVGWEAGGIGKWRKNNKVHENNVNEHN